MDPNQSGVGPSRTLPRPLRPLFVLHVGMAPLSPCQRPDLTWQAVRGPVYRPAGEVTAVAVSGVWLGRCARRMVQRVKRLFAGAASHADKRLSLSIAPPVCS